MVSVVHNDIVRATDAGQVYCLVLLDLIAAFDTVDHRILMDVLSSRFGVNDHVYDWFHYYLSGRIQSFSTPYDTCNAVALICSVPKFSVVRPLLIITYTEDAEDLIYTFSVKDHTYADDTPLLAHMRFTEVHAIPKKSRDVWVKSRIGELRNGYKETQTNRNNMVRIESQSFQTRIR